MPSTYSALAREVSDSLCVAHHWEASRFRRQYILPVRTERDCTAMTRKHIMRSALFGSCVAMGLAACGNDASSTEGESNTIVLADGGGTFSEAAVKAVYEPCEDELGIEVEVVPYDYSVGQIKAQVQGPQEWDVVSLGAFLTEDEASGILAPIDRSIVNIEGLSDDLIFKYWVPYDVTVIGLGYNTDQITGEPAGWPDLWDSEKYPGTGTLEKNAVSFNLELALLADGVAPEDVYPIDYDRAFKKLDELFEARKMMFYDSGTTLVQQYQTGTAVIGSGWGGRFTQAAAEGAPLSLVTNGAIEAFTNWAVLKTAPNQEDAMRFINCAISAEREAAFVEEFPGQGPANTEAYDLLSESAKSALPDPDDPTILHSSISYWATEFADATERWNQWLAKHGG